MTATCAGLLQTLRRGRDVPLMVVADAFEEAGDAATATWVRRISVHKSTERWSSGRTWRTNYAVMLPNYGYSVLHNLTHVRQHLACVITIQSRRSSS